VLAGKYFPEVVRQPHEIWPLLNRHVASAAYWLIDLVYRSRRELGAIGLFLALTLIVTYPLIFQLTSHIPICCDTWLYYW
jgi:hypothetical protein